ncbi:SGNH/GDSL hydrolase family protein [Massilia sp. DWR3-1-1]|uniref:SGNH/GDSL hydrolase family protein n=1 Tax=Massilia sp. DWR3-1-1 TaxID=2804559 RepID=UPI003CF1D815
MIGLILGGAAGRQIAWGDTSKTNIVFVGNSIVVGDGVGYNTALTWPTRLALQAPINGAMAIPNLGHDGWDIPTLDGAGDTSARFVEGKTNIMFFYEGTNSLKGGTRSPATTFSQLTTYIANRRAEHDWKIILISTIPFIEGATDAVSITQNNNVDAFNALMAAQYRAIGAVGYIDVRAGAPWGAMPDYTRASFEAYCTSLFLADFTHPNVAGTQLLADLAAPKLSAIRVR